MADYLDNPAGRLLWLIEQARKEDQTLAAINAWANVFGVDVGDRYALMCRCTDMVQLLQVTRAAVVELSDSDPDFHLRHLGVIETMLANFQMLEGQQIGQFLNRLTPEALYGLEACASLLHRECPEPTLTQADFEELVAQVRDLIDNTLRSDELDAEIKQYIVDRLRSVEDALIHIRITGIQGINVAADGAAGGLLRYWQRVGKTRIGIACRDFIGKLISVTGAANDVIEMGNRIKEIGGH
jgi:hypothetical protein